MTSKHGPNRRFKIDGNQTIEGIRNFNDHETIHNYVREHGKLKIQGQQPKEFMWLYTNWMKTLHTPANEKWTKKLHNWTHAHPELAIDYLLEVSESISQTIGVFGDRKDVLFFLMKRMDIEHLIKRPSFQHKVNG